MQTQTIQAHRPIHSSSAPAPEAGAADALANCNRIADAGEAAIEATRSGNARTFLEAGRQTGGQ